jgi:hypothetical protein
MSFDEQNRGGRSQGGSGSSGSGSQAASDMAQDQGQDPLEGLRPSQAEGDRDTIDEDIEEKEAQGDL